MGEVFNGDPAVLARYIDVLGSPSVFDFALKDNLSSDAGSLDALAGVFAKDEACRDASKLTTFTDNHDVPRFVSEVQARGGNTAETAQRLDLALSLMCAARRTPSIYQGTEIAQVGKGDPYNFPLGQGNRENMDFARVATSPTAARITVLAAAQAGGPFPAPGPATGTLAARWGRADLRLPAGAQWAQARRRGHEQWPGRPRPGECACWRRPASGHLRRGPAERVDREKQCPGTTGRQTGGHSSGMQTVTVPATGVRFDLARDLRTR